jgi:hypothetical protein
MRCSYCGTENPPGTRLCTNCRFILREEEIFEEPRPSTWERRSPYGTQSVPNKKTRLLTTLVVIAVIAAVTVGTFLDMFAYSSDTSMEALLFYSYSPTGATEGLVRVWGDVWSLQTRAVEVSLKILISDAQGHSSSDTIYVGVLEAYGRGHVDQQVSWRYLCYSEADLTVEYDIRTRSPSLL